MMVTIEISIDKVNVNISCRQHTQLDNCTQSEGRSVLCLLEAHINILRLSTLRINKQIFFKW